MKSFAQLNEEIEELNELFGKKKVVPYSPKPTPESNAVTARAYKSKGEKYDPNEPLHTIPGAHMHKQLSDHHKKTGRLLNPDIMSDRAKLAHHARMGWAHAVVHETPARYNDGPTHATADGRGYKLTRKDNAKLAFDAEKKGQNSVEHLYHHLVSKGVSHKDAVAYSGDPDPRTGHAGYDSEYGDHFARAFNAGRNPPIKRGVIPK